MTTPNSAKQVLRKRIKEIIYKIPGDQKERQSASVVAQVGRLEEGRGTVRGVREDQVKSKSLEIQIKQTKPCPEATLSIQRQQLGNGKWLLHDLVWFLFELQIICCDENNR